MPLSNQQEHVDGHIEVTEANVEQSQATRALTKAEGYFYQSALPHPDIVKGYQQIDPTFPERIIRQFEENAEHFRKQESKAMDCDASEKKRGQWMAFTIILLGFGATVITAWLGISSASIVTALGTVSVIFKGVFAK